MIPKLIITVFLILIYIALVVFMFSNVNTVGWAILAAIATFGYILWFGELLARVWD